MSWPTCISAWREAVSKVCQKPIVKSAATSLGICVVLATPLVISWWSGGRHAHAGAAVPEFDLPRPANYRDELMKPGDETKSGYVYLDLINRLQAISTEMKANDLSAKAEIVDSIISDLHDHSKTSPWPIKTYDESFSFGGVVFGR